MTREKLAEVAAEATRAGAKSIGRDGVTVFVSDGRLRWHDRETKGRTLRWRRAAVNDAEAVDLAASLVDVSDDDIGWLDITDAAPK